MNTRSRTFRDADDDTPATPHWTPPCVKHAGGIGDEPCWCGACEPPETIEADTQDAQPARRSIRIPAEPKITEPQRRFILALLDQHEVAPEHADRLVKMLRISEDPEEFGMSKATASKTIDWLKEQPAKARTQAPARESGISKFRDDVPAGRYAVTGDDGTTDFYKVDRPDEGRWAGYVFVKLLIAHGGFGDDLAEQRLSMPAQITILDRIADAGVAESMQRYGREIGRCGHCGRTLTDNESIERGIGPVCAGKMGWS